MATFTLRSTRMLAAAAAAGRGANAVPVRLAPPRSIPSCSRVHAAALLHATPSTSQWGMTVPSSSGKTRRCVATAAAAPEAAAAAPGLTFQSATAALMEVQKAWDSSDTDKSGQLSLDEACTLLASAELQHAASTMTGLPLAQMKPLDRAEIEKLYKSADSDKSNTLNHMEFLALFLAATTKTIKANPIVLAEAVIYMVDKDRNGKIDGKEMKSVLALFGVPPMLLMPIPDFLSVDYKPVLGTVAKAMGHAPSQA